MRHPAENCLNRLLPVVAVALLAACATPAVAPVPVPRGDVSSAEVPEPFWDFDPQSELTINYPDVDALLGAMVVDVGRSSRTKLQPAAAQTGTRLKANVRRKTSTEGNRFRFEAFEDNELYQQILSGIRADLEGIPDQIPLKHFSRNEQLAYWLNLYNITLLEKLVKIYPEKNLKEELAGRNSILDEQSLRVSGIPLSLNDIQHTILRWNHDSNPMVIYGLYQGVVGGPNIRKTAYTGENVNRLLEDNAREFINSNRGTESAGDHVFRVAGYYGRNLGYFANLDSQLEAHILRYIEGVQKEELLNATRLVADLEDWTITDVHGTTTKISESFARNRAAVIGSSPAIDEVWLTRIVTVRGSEETDAPGAIHLAPQERFGSDASGILEEFLRKKGINQRRTGLKSSGQISFNQLTGPPGTKQKIEET